MKFTGLVKASLIAAPLALGVVSFSAVADVSKAMSEAEAELAAAQKVGHVWRLVDKATGSRAVNIDKLFKAGKKAQEEGNEEEAMRIYMRVKDAALLGQEQAKSQANAGPMY